MRAHAILYSCLYMRQYMGTDMKTAVVIGASGHAGSFITPRLVRDGYRVISLSRGNRTPYTIDMPEWKETETVRFDRAALEAEGNFGRLIAEYRPDVVCDTIAYTPEQTIQLCESLSSGTHLIQLGTIWVYGYKLEVPVTEDHPRTSKDDYGVLKTQIEDYLMERTAAGKIRATVIQPGHISGRGWLPINPQGNLNPKVYESIIRGEEVVLPDDGQSTLHHVHARDVAGLVSACLKNPQESAGQTFHATTVRAVTLTGFAELLYRRFGHTPQIRYCPWEMLKDQLSKSDADITENHMQHSPACSMEKAEKMLGFIPRYTTIETVMDSLSWQIENGVLRSV